MKVIVIGTAGFGGIHFLLHEDYLPQIIIFNENHLGIGCREVVPSDLVGILEKIPPSNTEFLIEKLSLRQEDEFIFLLEKEPIEQYEFCFEKNTGNQRGCHSIKTKNSCRSRSPPRAGIYYIFPLFLI